MGNTIKITKSKAMSFKKLSFLYLVFILFLFFSSPGQYVSHYPYITKTQTELNKRLFNSLKEFSSTDPKQLDLKLTTVECVNEIGELEEAYLGFADQYGIYGDKLKENQFAEKQFRKAELGKKFVAINDKFIGSFSQISNNDIKTQLVSPIDFSGVQHQGLDFFFKETPNGVISSVFEYVKSVYLTNSISVLTKTKIVLPKYVQVTLEEAGFVQKFKRILTLGNPFEMEIKADEDLVPSVMINGINIDPERSGNSNIYKIKYLPASHGNYSVDVQLGEKRLFSGFKVLKPQLRFVLEESSFTATVGKPLVVALDTQYFPSRNVEFKSNRADIKRKQNILFITPKQVGLFEVKMESEGTVIDAIELYANDAESIEVALLDASGQPTEISNAHKLESLNTFWQVVSFRMTILDSLGNRKSMPSATRFIRNNLKSMEALSGSGSSIIFDQIKLVGTTPNVTKEGRPIVIVK